MKFKTDFDCIKCNYKNNLIVDVKGNTKFVTCEISGISLELVLCKCKKCGTINVLQVDNKETQDKKEKLMTKMLMALDSEDKKYKKLLEKEIRLLNKTLDKKRENLLKEYRKFFRKNVDFIEGLWYNGWYNG